MFSPGRGKGYSFAENDPSRFHGIAPFCVETGAATAGDKTIPTYTQVFGRTMVRLAREHPKMVAITAAMCDGTGLDHFAREFPERFFDVGIAEQHGVTFAAGLALEGIIPVVAIYSTFMQRAYDQVLHDVCIQNLPVVLALDRGGFVGDDGQTHQGLFDFSYLRAIPNMIVMAPKDENEFQHMLKTAVACGRPVSVRYPRGAGVGAVMDDTLSPLPIGKAELVCEGSDLAIVAIGATVYPALAAADKLRQEGIHVRVINARFVKPLDQTLLMETARSLKKIITVEENVLMGGFGSALLELFEKLGVYDVRVRRLGVPDEFVAHATQAEQRSLYGIDEAGIIRAVRSMIDGSV